MLGSEREGRELEGGGADDLRDIRGDVLLLPFAASGRRVEERGNPPPPGLLSRHGCCSKVQTTERFLASRSVLSVKTDD